MPDFFFIGEEELLVAFRLVGVAGRAVSGRDEALEAFLVATRQVKQTLRPDEPASPETTGAGSKVLILSSEVSKLLEDEARDWQFEGQYPLIVEIPSPGAAPDEGRSLLAAIREAVGISI
jgi:V/A-type H+-transporting ATPase subunit F